MDIDFSDINVTSDKTYYIVCRTLQASYDSEDFYYWPFGYSDSGQIPYERGEPWESFYSGSYYIVCKTLGGDSNNFYDWAVASKNNSYQKGACCISNDSGELWSEKIYDDMYFQVIGNAGSYELDQFQHQGDHFGININKNRWVAQSFEPTQYNLTKIRLLMFANVKPSEKIFVSIRENLSGEDLTTTFVTANDFWSFSNGGMYWYEFDFPDVEVTPENTYYIVCRTPETNNPYSWVVMAYDYYPAGEAYVSTDGGNQWIEDSMFIGEDLCFETYYKTNSWNDNPNSPTITGPTSGKVGTSYNYDISSIDPDGDNVYYYVDWGDNTNSGWLGPYSSGEMVTVSHTWSLKGTYTIKAKAKDVHGAESDWATLPVIMPMDQPQSSPQSNPSPQSQPGSQSQPQVNPSPNPIQPSTQSISQPVITQKSVPITTIPTSTPATTATTTISTAPISKSTSIPTSR